MVEIRSFRKRLESLKNEFSSFRPLFQELSDYHLAHRGRFLTSDRNKGHKRNTKQINNTSHLAARTLASGMMAGITSPARPWFRLSTGDATLDDAADVKAWLFDVQKRMYNVFSASNTYNSLHMVYQELGVFGTAALGVYEDFNNVIWCKPYTIGSYYLGVNGQNYTDTFYREFEYTVAQCVKEYGLENCSQNVQQLWERGNTESWVQIVHAVEPNDDRDRNSPMARDKAFRSVYFENGAGNKADANKFLRRSGFDEFPVLTPRWDVTGEDIYATDCPGMTALGDTKALQLGERRLYQALDKVVNPPLQAPASMRNKMTNGRVGPDEIVWNESAADKISSIYDFRPDLNAMKVINDAVEERIKRAFYEDLFLMLANTDRRQITAREVAEKHEEKLLMLGPVLERLHSELLDPLIDRTFNILQRNGVLPPPPPALQNKELTVEYVSVLAQAQRMVATGTLERVAGFASQLATVWPEARHKIDAPQMIDDYAEAMGVNPAVIRSDDVVAQMVQAEQQQQAMAQAMAMGEQMANVAKTTSEAKTTDDNVLGNAARTAGLL